jgi:hypothetical protein
MRKVRDYFKNTGFILLLICFFALLIRVWLFVALQPWDEEVVQHKVIVGDANSYHTLALSILTTHSFSGFGANRTPCYPLFIAFIYFLFGVKPWIVLFLQLFLDTGTVIIVYFIAKELFKPKPVPLIAAFLYSISFPSAYYSTRLLTDIPFTFVFAIGILIFVRALKKNKLFGFMLTGFFIGLATLIRPIAQYFPLVLLIVLVLSNSRPIQKLRTISILLISFLIVVSAWQFRNLRVYGHYDLSIMRGYNLCINVMITKAHMENISRKEAEKELVGASLNGVTDPFERSRIWRKIALPYISKHPLQYMKYHLKGVLKMFLGTGRSGILDIFGIKEEPPVITENLSDAARRIIKNFYNELPVLFLLIKQILEYMFLIIGLMVMSLKDKKIFLLLLIMTILYFVAATGHVGYSRFRVPIVPFYLIISAKGIFETFKFIQIRVRVRRTLPRDT